MLQITAINIKLLIYSLFQKIILTAQIYQFVNLIQLLLDMNIKDFKDRATLSRRQLQIQNINTTQRVPQQNGNIKANSKNNRLMNILADVMRTILYQQGNNESEAIENDEDDQNIDFTDLKEQVITKNAKNKLMQIIVISNKNNVEKSKYGEKYKQQLDSRDQMLTHQFQFILEISSSEMVEGKTSFMKTEAYQTLCKNIQEYLVDVVENVASVSFNLLINEKLKENQSKDYASKNILLNVRSLFREIMETLTKQNIIDQKQHQKLRLALCQLVDETLNQSLTNLSSYYPQAPPTGGTARMREALLSIDRNNDQQLDFLFTQRKYFELTKQDSGDYTEYIMRVVNRVIQVTSEIDSKDSLQQTLFEKFVAFSEHLFWTTQQDSYDRIIQKIGKNDAVDEIDNKVQQNFSADGQSQIKTITQEQEIQQFDYQQVPETNNICSFFGNFLNQNRKQLIPGDDNDKKKILNYLRKPVFAQASKDSLPPLIPQEKRQKMIQEMKKRHDFQIGQKIPGSVKSFSKKDLMDKKFSSKSSAVLRILTKWAQNLENIFDNPQSFTTNRIYPFKTLNHQMIYPKKQIKEFLFKQLVEQKGTKQRIKQKLINKNKQLQSTFLAQDSNENLSMFIKRYTQTRVIASKMNALLIQFMKNYVSQLINLLMEAGKVSLQKQYDINLVVFKIGDLMRSKIYCNQTSFIRLLKTLYILEESNAIKNQQPLFKLVRIKNKLDSKDNNILINYLFMGKIQCELQMSVQKMAGKELNYYSFSHFLYELTRGKFGVLAECATIISQNDPIISSSSFSSSDSYYQPKKKAGNISKKKIKQETFFKQPQIQGIAEVVQKDQDEGIKQIPKEDKRINKMFVCKECQNLKFDQNPDLLKRNHKQQQTCNQCLIQIPLGQKNQIQKQKQWPQYQQQNQYLAEKRLKDDKWKGIIKHLKEGQISKLISYQQISDLEKYNSQVVWLIFSINHKKNEWQFSIFNKHDCQGTYYISPITKDMWQKYRVKEDNIQYEDVTFKIQKKNYYFPEFTYIIPAKESSINRCPQIFKQMKFLNFQIIQQQLSQLDGKCQQKISKKNILKTLENKNPSLQFYSDQVKFEKMNKLVYKKMKGSIYSKNRIKDSLRNIQFIFAESIGSSILAPWIKMCQKTQILNLSGNNIKNIQSLESMVEIRELILEKNSIKEIDWKKLINLEKLNLGQNGLQSFSMENLPESISEIDLSYNELQTFNFQYRPSRLKKIEIQSNHLKTANLKRNCESLQYLNISFNQLNTFEYQNLSSIRTLFLNENELSSFQFEKLLSLRELYVSKNKISSFKCENMPYLQEFYIDRNKLLLDISIKNCPNLRLFYLDQTSLPKLQLIDFPALAQLFIGHNIQLKWLQLKQLPSLNYIDMQLLSPFSLSHIQIQNCNQVVQINCSTEMNTFLKSQKNPIR